MEDRGGRDQEEEDRWRRRTTHQGHVFRREHQWCHYTDHCHRIWGHYACDEARSVRALPIFRFGFGRWRFPVTHAHGLLVFQRRRRCFQGMPKGVIRRHRPARLRRLSPLQPVVPLSSRPRHHRRAPLPHLALMAASRQPTCGASRRTGSSSARPVTRPETSASRWCTTPSYSIPTPVRHPLPSLSCLS